MKSKVLDRDVKNLSQLQYDKNYKV